MTIHAVSKPDRTEKKERKQQAASSSNCEKKGETMVRMRMEVMSSPVVEWFLLLAASSSVIFFSSAASASSSANTQRKVTENPADELVAVFNTNRTAHKLSPLHDNSGLACIALQYIKAYQGDCGAVGGPDAKKPADSEFVENFAPSCGVEASTLSPIIGRLLGCQSRYVHASDAFSEILMKNNKSLEILYNVNSTQFGAAVSGTDGGSPYFWCTLFSSGQPNTTFVFEDGVAKITRPGCFSGANDDCNSAHDWSAKHRLWLYATGALIALTFAFVI